MNQFWNLGYDIHPFYLTLFLKLECLALQAAMHMRDDYIGQTYEASLCLSRSGSVGPTAVTVYYVIQFEGFVERVLTKQEETLAQSSAGQRVCKGQYRQIQIWDKYI